MQVGDGTTSVVILAGEFLKEAKGFVEEGAHPRVRGRERARVSMQEKDLSKDLLSLHVFAS